MICAERKFAGAPVPNNILSFVFIPWCANLGVCVAVWSSVNSAQLRSPSPPTEHPDACMSQTCSKCVHVAQLSMLDLRTAGDNHYCSVLMPKTLFALMLMKAKVGCFAACPTPISCCLLNQILLSFVHRLGMEVVPLGATPTDSAVEPLRVCL